MALNMKKDEFKLCSAFVIIALFFILAWEKWCQILNSELKSYKEHVYLKYQSVNMIGLYP